MTDDLAMDLDLDGPEKNVYVVNPQQPTTFNVSFYYNEWFLKHFQSYTQYCVEHSLSC